MLTERRVKDGRWAMTRQISPWVGEVDMHSPKRQENNAYFLHQAFISPLNVFTKKNAKMNSERFKNIVLSVSTHFLSLLRKLMHNNQANWDLRGKKESSVWMNGKCRWFQNHFSPLKSLLTSVVLMR